MSPTRHPLDGYGQATTATEYPGADTRRVLVLAPGAGAGQSHRFMVDVASAIAARGTAVITFDFLYAHAGRRIPDRNDRLEETWRVALAWARARHGPDARLFVGGKSMGGRIASQVVAGHAEAEPAGAFGGLVFFGYPLHPPGEPERLRAAHLPRVRAPMLFIQGSRDPFGAPDELRPIVDGAAPGSRLVVVDGGDHSLAPAKASGRTFREVLESVADETTRFMRAIAG